MNTLLDFEKKINLQYQKILRDLYNKNKHIFITTTPPQSLKNNQEKYNILINTSSGASNGVDNNNKVISDRAGNELFIPKKVASERLINRIISALEDPKKKLNYEKVKNKVFKLRRYLLPESPPRSTDDDVDLFDSEIIKVLILGAGPMGLYTALYLNDYFNNQTTIKKRVEILIIENRVARERFMLPYHRTTQFGFDYRTIRQFFPSIECWDDKHITKHSPVRQFDFIAIYEYIMYLAAYKDGIPMKFTSKISNPEEYANEHGFKYIFDCTGGKLCYNYKPSKYMKWNKFSMKSDDNNLEVKLVNPYKLVTYYKKYPITDIWVMLHFLQSDYFEILFGNMMERVNDPEDLSTLLNINNKIYTIDDYEKISKLLKSKKLRDLHNKIGIKSKFIKVVLFNNNSWHAFQCAKILKNNKMLITIGNSLGTSSFGIHFGFRTSQSLVREIIHNL